MRQPVAAFARSRRTLAAYLRTTALAFLTLSCAGGSEPTAPPPGGSGGAGGGGGSGSSRTASSIVVDPTTVGLSIGETRQLAAVARDAAGSPIEGKSIAWSSSNTANAIVANGLVTAVTGGAATITATADGVSGTASIMVGPAVASMAVAPATVTIPPGTTQQLTALFADASGNALTGRTATWSSSSDAIATVSATGLVTAVANGTVTISAASGSRVANAQVTVGINPATATVATVEILPAVPAPTVNAVTALSAQAKDVTGTVLTGRTFTWSSSDETVASIASDGKLTGRKAGTVTITATTAGKSATVNFTVGAQIPVASIFFLPTNPSVVLGGTETVTANLRDAAGQTLVNRTITWSSSNTNIFTVSAAGVLSGKTVGTATLTAQVDGVTATVTTTVRANTGTPSRIELTPKTGAVAVGTDFPITAKAFDALNNAVAGAQFTWKSNYPDKLSVDQNGVVRGVGEMVGDVEITASTTGIAGPVTAVATLTTLPPPSVGKVVALPAVFRIPTNSATQLEAKVYDNSLQPMNRTVSWSSSNTAVATVSSTGLLAGIADGTVDIKASSGDKFAVMKVTVVNGLELVQRIELRADGMLFIVGVPKKVYVDFYGSGGSTLLERYATLSVANTTIARIENDGTVTPLSAGTTSITATHGTKTVTVPITVLAQDAPYAIDIRTAGATTFEVSSEWLPLLGTIKNYSGGSIGTKAMTWRATNGAVTLEKTTSMRDNSDGWWKNSFRATSAGTVSIIGSADGVADTLTLVITPGAAVASVSIAPNPFKVVKGLTTQAEATIIDVNGKAVQRIVTWTTGNAGIATVSATGLVTGVGAGSTTLTATSEGKSATINVDVANESAAVATIELSPTNFELRLTQERSITATLKNAQGTVLTGKTVTWTSSAGNIVYITNPGAVGNPGIVHAERVGAVTITATSEGVSASTTVTGAAAPAAVAHVLVEPNPATIAVNGTVQLSAIARDAAGNIVSSTTTWSSDNTSVATVSTTGLVRGIAAGTTRVNATIGGILGYATITVTGGAGGGGGGGGAPGGAPPVGTLTGKTPGKCDFWWQLPTPAPGTTGPWIASQLFLPGLDARVKAGTFDYTSGTPNPSYQYTVEFRNAYNQKIHFTLTGPSASLPSSGGLSKTVDALAEGGSNSFVMQVPSAIFVYIEGIGFGMPWPGVSPCK